MEDFYYQNTYDMKTDEVVEVKDEPLPVQEELDDEEWINY